MAILRKSLRQSPSLRSALKERLKGAGRITLLGIGSRFRGDDAAGLIVAEKVAESKGTPRLKVLLGETAPENMTGVIRKSKPTHIILVDAADFKKKPGTVRLVKPEEATGACFCTHQLPLQIMVDYLTKTMGSEVLIIGIQAKTLSFGSAMGEPVRKAALNLSSVLTAAIKEALRNK